MLFSSPPILALAALALTSSHFASSSPLPSSSSTAPCPWTNTIPTQPETIVANWYSLWAGNYSLINETVTPNIQVYQDRFPTGGDGSEPFPIFNSSAMLDFVKVSREGYETYSFLDDFHYGVENLMTLRWTLNATFEESLGATAEKGSHIAYNGTDILVLEPCSGLIQEVLSAQDLITLYHELGEEVGKV